jgi:hypothetical protein
MVHAVTVMTGPTEIQYSRCPMTKYAYHAMDASKNTEHPFLESQETIVPRRADGDVATLDVMENSPTSILEKKARIAGRTPPARPTRLVKPPRIGPMGPASPTRTSTKLRVSSSRGGAAGSQIVAQKEAIRLSRCRQQVTDSDQTIHEVIASVVDASSPATIMPGAYFVSGENSAGLGDGLEETIFEVLGPISDNQQTSTALAVKGGKEVDDSTKKKRLRKVVFCVMAVFVLAGVLSAVLGKYLRTWKASAAAPTGALGDGPVILIPVAAIDPASATPGRFSDLDDTLGIVMDENGPNTTCHIDDQHSDNEYYASATAQTGALDDGPVILMPAADIDPASTSSGCFNDLDTLIKVMDENDLLVAATYVLCPNTTFDMYCQKTFYWGPCPRVIYPRANTRIICGEDGSSANHCLVQGGAQVLFMKLQEREQNVKIMGITFDSSKDTPVMLIETGNFMFIDCVFSVWNH